METSILYTIAPLLGATCSGFVLRDIYEYVAENLFSYDNYIKYDIHLDEMPQLLDYSICETLKPKQDNLHLNAICDFDCSMLRKKKYKENKCDEKDIIAELRQRLKVIRKYTEET